MLTSFIVAVATGFPQLRPIWAPSGTALSCSGVYPKAAATLLASNNSRYVEPHEKYEIWGRLHVGSTPSRALVL